MKNEGKMETLEKKIKNLTYIVILGFIVLILLIAGLYFKDGNIRDLSVQNNSEGTETAENTQTTSYDVSRMKKITGSEAAKLFDNKKGTQFLYIGRSGCGYCKALVPELNKTIDEMEITVNYLELGSDFRTDFADLFKHLDVKAKINDESGTYGELLKSHGYTPIVVIIKNGKMVDGFVGPRESSTITETFKKYL